MKEIIVALDLETSGLVPGKHRTVEVGAYYKDKDGKPCIFKSDVCYGLFQPIEICDSALKINGFTKDRIFQASPSPKTVDERLALWFQEIGCQRTGDKRANLVGFNVGGFDLQFIKHDLPLSSSYISYRAIDLNSIFLLLSGKKGTDGPFSYKKWKSEAKKYAEYVLKKQGYEKKWHSALYDAMAAYYIYDWCKDKAVDTKWKDIKDSLKEAKNGAI